MLFVVEFIDNLYGIVFKVCMVMDVEWLMVDFMVVVINKFFIFDIVDKLCKVIFVDWEGKI